MEGVLALYQRGVRFHKPIYVGARMPSFVRDTWIGRRLYSDLKCPERLCIVVTTDCLVRRAVQHLQ